MLGSILRSDSIERSLAERQILVKDGGSKSWFVYVNRVLKQYELPSSVDLLYASYSKSQWKQLCDKAIHEYWSNKVLSDAIEKSTLRW